MIELSRNFITAREASNSLSQVLDRAQTSPQVITRNGKPAAVVIDPQLWDDMTRALELEAESLRILADAAAARADRGEGLTRAAAQARLDAWATQHGLPSFDPATLTIEQLAQYVDLDPSYTLVFLLRHERQRPYTPATIRRKANEAAQRTNPAAPSQHE